MSDYNETLLSASAMAAKGAAPEDYLLIYHENRNQFLLRQLRTASDWDAFVKLRGALDENDKIRELVKTIEASRLNPDGK